ncbi:uncharacterized protein LOC118648909 [Monomorium pharaonis]|uniref:uncharacterized protein LOC118648909 n=1 Tax=Monomorium pharaonis TaxID=307658 RepID=UPI001746B9C3|nr:uncharacterized protein LOC118648909 [Monomorium pharaonis]
MTKDRKLCSPRNVRRYYAAPDHVHRKSAVLARHNEEHFPQQDIEESTVFDLVYAYLSKCADKNMKWRQRNCACNKFNKQHARKKDVHGRDVATIRTNLDKGIFDNSSKWSRLRADKNILAKRVSSNSSRECIADYTRAVRYGRRRAKFYARELRKALLYGLQSGLLIPIDRRKNELRVSRKLGMFLSKNTREANEDSLNIATSDTDYSI